MEHKVIELLDDEDRLVLAAIAMARPTRPELAFATFAKAAGKNLSTDFRGADLRGYMLRGQDLTEVNLEGADLRDADLREAIGYRQKGTRITGALISRERKRTDTFHRISAIPAPPQPYVAHPYTLLHSRNLIGRQSELNALTDWLTKPAATREARIFCLVALGGMGKSALTWTWFNQIAPNELKLAGRMWWSFYESDATFENFVIRALCYVTGEAEKAVRARTPQDREAMLLRELNAKPYLFVLDGLERILVAYNRTDASSLADDDYDAATANYVAGAIGLPATAAQSFVGQHRLRQTTDPRDGSLLQKLAQVDRSRILISTRLYPGELQLPNGNPRPGCFVYFLRGLSDDDAITFWRALNSSDRSGEKKELVPIFRSIENHPLLVQALAREVANSNEAPGDFAKWRAAHPDFDPSSLPLVQSRTHILKFALDGLSEQSRNVLSMIVGFRMPTSYASLEALLVGSGKTFKSAPELDRALSELEDRGLIGWDRAANRYDAHPIVRGVVWQLTEATERRAVYEALDAHFELMPTPDADMVESLADLAPAIERYNTLAGLGRFDDALQLFRDRLDRAMLYRLAANRERITLLERLFSNGINELPAVTNEADQAWVLNALALGYEICGQPGRSLPLFRRNIEIRRRRDEDKNLQIVLSNLGQALGDAGRLYEAEIAFRAALVLARKPRDEFDEGVSLRAFGRMLALTNSPLAVFALGRALNMAIAQSDHQGEGLAYAYLAERNLLLGNASHAASLADHARELAAEHRIERDFIRSVLWQGRAALILNQFDRADERLHHVLSRARAVNVVDLELPALIALAELALKHRNVVEARTRLDDVWEAAERGPYPMQQADAYNVLADIALAEGYKPTAIDAATKAYKAAWCDGPPYAYHCGLEKAKAHLKALGAGEPILPPFDESKFEPLPEIEINPKDKYWVDPGKLDD